MGFGRKGAQEQEYYSFAPRKPCDQLRKAFYKSTHPIAQLENTLVLIFVREHIQSILVDLHDLFHRSLVARIPERRCFRKNEGKNTVKVWVPALAYRMNPGEFTFGTILNLITALESVVGFLAFA